MTIALAVLSYVLVVAWLNDVDWKAVGAIAGPSLALLSLLWQAREKLKRPIFASVGHRFDTYFQHQQTWVIITSTARIINPRPTSIIVANVTLEATKRERWRPWRRVVLAADHNLQQIQGPGEACVTVIKSKYMKPQTLRIVVRLRGHHRALRSPWLPDVGKDAVQKVIDKNASPEHARLRAMLPPGAESAPPDTA